MAGHLNKKMIMKAGMKVAVVEVKEEVEVPKVKSTIKKLFSKKK